MLEPVFEARLTHTGVYADGRPNVSSILINDLDVGFQSQNRKVPVYVPAGGSIDIALTSNSLFSINQGTISKLVEAGLITVEILNPGTGVTGSSSIVIVDGGSTAEYENGSWDYPWKTLQKAINSLYGDADDPTPAPPSVAGEDRTLMVSQGTYDEDLVFPAAGAINMIALGSVSIGTPTSSRTVTRIVDPALNVDAPLVPVLNLAAASVAAGGFALFGTFTFADVGAGQVQNFVWEGGSQFGTFDATGMTARLNFDLRRCTFITGVWAAPTGVGAIDWTKWFVGTPVFDYLSKVTNCEFLGGLTMATDPVGVVFLDTEIAGTVTAPINFQVDYFTNGSMANNAVVKAGGWAATVPVGRTVPY